MVVTSKSIAENISQKCIKLCNQNTYTRFTDWTCVLVRKKNDNTVQIIENNSIAYEMLKYELSIFHKHWAYRQIKKNIKDDVLIIFKNKEDCTEFLSTQNVVENRVAHD
jgi:hypothetical protein